ncbi:MAG: ribonuclease H-like domain-containing protein [Nitrospirota bacterium]
MDIETTGLSHYYDDITLVGLYDGERVTTLISGHNLHQLNDLLPQYQIVITFNGTLFDIPFLKTKFPALQLPPIHLDLRYLLKRLGYSGGLKQIERRLGLKRSKEAESVDGLMATVLWARYLRGDLSALERLVKYNTADVTSLWSLVRFSCQRLASRLLNGTGFPRQEPRLRRPKPVPVRVSMNGPGVKLTVGGHRLVLKSRPGERPTVTLSNLLARMPGTLRMPKVVGIDLRASEERPTGWALLKGEWAETRLIKTDKDLVKETVEEAPDIISIDSPLGIPLGRCCTEESCPCRAEGILRECERTLWRRGVRVYPCLLPSMRKLTERGVRLAREFRKRGYTVIESYPGAAQDIMRIPRKRSSLEDLARGLEAFGIRGAFLSQSRSHDELDAITSAVVGYFFLTGDYEALGDSREECLIVPKLDNLVTAITSR